MSFWKSEVVLELIELLHKPSSGHWSDPPWLEPTDLTGTRPGLTRSDLLFHQVWCSSRAPSTSPRWTTSAPTSTRSRTPFGGRWWRWRQLATETWGTDCALSLCCRCRSVLERCVLRRGRLGNLFVQVYPRCVLVGGGDHDYRRLRRHDVRRGRPPPPSSLHSD